MQEKKEAIWPGPMTKAPTTTEKSKEQQDKDKYAVVERNPAHN